MPSIASDDRRLSKILARRLKNTENRRKLVDLYRREELDDANGISSSLYEGPRSNSPCPWGPAACLWIREFESSRPNQPVRSLCASRIGTGVGFLGALAERSSLLIDRFRAPSRPLILLVGLGGSARLHPTNGLASANSLRRRRHVPTQGHLARCFAEHPTGGEEAHAREITARADRRG
jgi:hypothetical protein